MGVLRSTSNSSVSRIFTPIAGEEAGVAESERIMIIEDDADLASLLRYNFEAAGYVVSCAGNGASALTSLKECLPSLAVIDWGIPILSGVELVRQLRRCETTRALPIIMLTGRCSSAERTIAISTGVDRFIAKPFSLVELMGAIDSLLRHRPCNPIRKP